MARALILLLLLPLAACQHAQRIDAAGTAVGQARANPPPLVLPEACTAHMERVVPKAGEKARWTQKRWEFVADARDKQADDCRDWAK